MFARLCTSYEKNYGTLSICKSEQPRRSYASLGGSLAVDSLRRASLNYHWHVGPVPVLLRVKQAMKSSGTLP